MDLNKGLEFAQRWTYKDRAHLHWINLPSLQANFGIQENLNSQKCEKHRDRLENIYIRPKRTSKRNCGHVPSKPYETNFTIDPEFQPCLAVQQLADEMIRFADTFFVGDECPRQRIMKVREITIYIILELGHYSKLPVLRLTKECKNGK